MTQIENLEAMLAQGKDGALVRYGLGTAYAAMPDQAAKEQAKAHLTACVGFDPEYSAAYLKLAQVLQSLGETQRPMKYILKASRWRHGRGISKPLKP